MNEKEENSQMSNTESSDDGKVITDEERSIGREPPQNTEMETIGQEVENPQDTLEKNEKDQFLVDFGKADSENPRNWLKKKKWSMTAVVAIITFVSPAVSSVAAPVSYQIAEKFGITSTVERTMVISLYVLAYAVGPLIFSPLSELYGRKIIFVACNIGFLGCNLGCGFARTKTQILVLRFFTGLGGSAPLSVTGGIMNDIWSPDERARAMTIYSAGPLLGPAVGPIIAGFIGQYSTWRWAFWSTSILDGVCLITLILVFKETYTPLLLQWKTAKLRKEFNDQRYYNKFEFKGSKVKKLLDSLIRPARLISTQVIIQFLALYMSFLYGLMYLLLTSFSTLWIVRYRERLDIAGLHYIAMCIGFLLGAQIGLRFQTWARDKLKEKNNGEALPEFRIPPMIFGGPLLTIGLLWYGWSAQARIFWLVPDIGIAIVSAATIVCYTSIQMYLVDAYGLYAASAIASASSVRSLCGFAFPLFAPKMFDKLGYGWGCSVLALCSLVLLPGTYVFFKYGAKLRARSTYCSQRKPT